jgi:ubiquinone/menaquinone biosynthesis C-methylase UbiE
MPATVTQNIWQNHGILLNRQVRRSQLTKKLLLGKKVKSALDLGCGEGFTTKFIAEACENVTGIELNDDALEIARRVVEGVRFVHGSITNKLPFSDREFDAVCILEVLEHLPKPAQLQVCTEIDRVLQPGGILLVSVPFKENRQFTTCIHCNQLTPLYGHLHSLDEKDITALLSAQYELQSKSILPNVELISCSRICSWMPLTLWLACNRILGLVRSGYWMVLMYQKK